MINTFTIPKELAAEKELVIISRRALDDLLRRAQMNSSEMNLTATQRTALRNGRKSRKSGNFMTFNELKEKLDTSD